MSEQERPKTAFNIVSHRGDPTSATTISGHRVEKKDFVIIPSPLDPATFMSIKCADYHNEHFVYIDPLFEKELDKSEDKQYWFAMCTCGAPAVIIGGKDASLHEGHNWIQEIIARGGHGVENLLVCQHYMTALMNYGHGWHQGQSPRRWE